MREPLRSEKGSDSTNTFVTALEEARLLTERPHSLGTTSPVYPPLLNQIIPPSGTALPPIEKPQRKGQGRPALENVRQAGPVGAAPIIFIHTLYIALVLGSLLHSWLVLGGSLLIGLILTGIMFLSGKRDTFQRLTVSVVWLLFALVWGYVGWLVCDAYLPVIVHFLCAFIGFILGLVVYPLTSGIVSPGKPTIVLEAESTQEIKCGSLAAFIDSVCISLVFGYLMHSWWILGAGLLIGLILTAIILFSTKDNIYLLNQPSVGIVWLLFALIWGYAGWLVCAAYIPSIVHFLCAVVGFILGFIGYPGAYVIVSVIAEKETSN